MLAYRDLVRSTLAAWVATPNEAMSMLGLTKGEAQWRQYDTVDDFGPALGHETLGTTRENRERENSLAGRVGDSEWIADALEDLETLMARRLIGDGRQGVDVRPCGPRAG